MWEEVAVGETEEKMSGPTDRPATRDDVIYAVFVIIIALMLCNASDSCSRRLQINNEHMKTPAVVVTFALRIRR